MSSKSAQTNRLAETVIETVEGLVQSTQQDETPIAGLRASNTGPTPFGQATWFYATVDFGTNVRYEWDLGDGHVAYGASIQHIYAESREYLVTVIARNDVSELEATTFAAVVHHEVWDGPIASAFPSDLDDAEVDVDSRKPSEQPFARHRIDRMWKMDQQPEEIFCE